MHRAPVLNSPANVFRGLALVYLFNTTEIKHMELLSVGHI
jgi:hypothetical protein